MMGRWSWWGRGLIALGMLGATLSAAQPVLAQVAGSSGGAKRPAPGPGTGGVGLVPQGGGAAGGMIPAAGGGGGVSGGGATGGGGASAGSPAPGGACDSFMLCTPPHAGHGSMISFTISLAPEIADQPIDQIRITLKISGEAVSWSPLVLPDPGQPLVLPLTTQMFQSCANTYGEAIATVQGLQGGKVVAAAAGTFEAQDCVAFSIPVELQSTATMGADEAMAGSAAAEDAALAGGSAAGKGGTTASHSGTGGAGGTTGDVNPDGDESGCGCAIVGAPAHRPAWISSALGSAFALVRVRRRRRASVARGVPQS